MSDHDLALRTAALHTEVQQLRSKLSWVDDADLRTIEDANPAAAWLLSAAFGGGGQIYNGDTLRGILMILASLGSLIAAGSIHGIFMLAWLGIHSFGSMHALVQARSVNRYLAARAEEQRHNAALQAPHPAYRLLSAMHPHAQAQGHQGHQANHQASLPAPAPASGPVAELKARLEKLAILHASGVINAQEHRERRLELLSEWTNLSSDSVDELLYELLPLIRSGTITQEDVDFIKSLGGRR